MNRMSPKVRLVASRLSRMMSVARSRVDAPAFWMIQPEAAGCEYTAISVPLSLNRPNSPTL